MEKIPVKNGNSGYVFYEGKNLRLLYESITKEDKKRILININNFDGPGTYHFSKGSAEVNMLTSQFKYHSRKNTCGYVEILDSDFFKKRVEGYVRFCDIRSHGKAFGEITEYFELMY